MTSCVFYCSSFDLERDAYDSDEDTDDEDKPYNSKMDEAKILEGNNKPGSGGSRLPIRNVLDVFQELKLAFGRS